MIRRFPAALFLRLLPGCGLSAGGLAALPPWPGLTLTGEPEKPPPFIGVPAFQQPEGARWERALTAIGTVPRSGESPRRLYWLELGGRAATFVPSAEPPSFEPFFELKRDGIETYSLAFDPEFPRRAFVYVATNEKFPAGKLFRKRNVIWRLKLDQLDPPKAGLDDALEIISWESEGHNGCDVAFGRDGMLWACTGDGEEPGDPRYLGQTADDLLGIVLRIDVRDATPAVPYRVPGDNPFVGISGVAPETWCYGLRNPWKMAFHPVSGELFLCDNGEDSWELVRLAGRGGNGGWSVFEGTHPFRPHLKLQGPSVELMRPVVEHPHTEMRSVIGGVFYQGARHPSLRGKFIYGDYSTGTVWAFEWKDGRAGIPQLIANTSHSIIDLSPDHENELLVACREGVVVRLEPTPPSQITAALPRKLSETGLFASTRTLDPAPGCVPYEIIAPAWHDGAQSKRFIALPPGTQLNPVDGAWHDNFELPDGAAAVQTLILGGRRIETRVIHRTDAEEWGFHSYAWNRDQTDAERVPAEGADRTVDGRDEGRTGEVWHFPSRFECMMCHTWPGHRVIGINPAQLNRDSVHGGSITGNQLAAWQQLGLLPKSPRPPEKLARLADPADESGPLERRARAALHTNCGHCHRPSGGGGGKPDFRLAWWFSRDEMGAIDAAPLVPMFGLGEARLIDSGNPENSMVYRRMNTLGPGRMPLLGCRKIDRSTVDLIRRWIESMR